MSTVTMTTTKTCFGWESPPPRNFYNLPALEGDVFISKYALSSGIIEPFAVKHRNDEDMYVSVQLSDKCLFGSFRIGVHAHETREEAAKAAEKMRLRKIASLKKAIARLETMMFF